MFGLQAPNLTQVVAGALAGWAGAARADYMAFKAWKSWGEFKTYDWPTATFRWFQGAVVGALAGAGYSSITGV